MGHSAAHCSAAWLALINSEPRTGAHEARNFSLCDEQLALGSQKRHSSVSCLHLAVRDQAPASCRTTTIMLENRFRLIQRELRSRSARHFERSGRHHPEVAKPSASNSSAPKESHNVLSLRHTRHNRFGNHPLLYLLVGRIGSNGKHCNSSAVNNIHGNLLERDPIAKLAEQLRRDYACGRPTLASRRAVARHGVADAARSTISLRSSADRSPRRESYAARPTGWRSFWGSMRCLYRQADPSLACIKCWGSCSRAGGVSQSSRGLPLVGGMKRSLDEGRR